MTEKLNNAWVKIKEVLKFIHVEYIKFPAYLLAHPFRGFDEFKRDKKARMSVAIAMIIAMILLQILQFQYEGFIVNPLDINDLNSLAQIAYVIVPIVVFVFANWSITTLFDGKGKVKEIFMLIGYSLFPMVVTKFIGLFVSNMIVEDEAALHGLIIGLGVFGTGYMLFTGLISIHEYGLIKCFITVLATLLAAMVLLFVALLFFDLFQKVFGFVYTIYREISLRYL